MALDYLELMSKFAQLRSFTCPFSNHYNIAFSGLSFLTLYSIAIFYLGNRERKEGLNLRKAPTTSSMTGRKPLSWSCKIGFKGGGGAFGPRQKGKRNASGVVGAPF